MKLIDLASPRFDGYGHHCPPFRCWIFVAPACSYRLRQPESSNGQCFALAVWPNDDDHAGLGHCSPSLGNAASDSVDNEGCFLPENSLLVEFDSSKRSCHPRVKYFGRIQLNNNPNYFRRLFIKFYLELDNTSFKFNTSEHNSSIEYSNN